jgi:hypothetical protein
MSIFFFLYLSSTALLAIAVAWGNIAFIIAFAIWSFWVSFTRFDKVGTFQICSKIYIVYYNLYYSARFSHLYRSVLQRVSNGFAFVFVY